MKDHPINPDGPRRPALLVFDVNETLSDICPLAARSEDVSAPAHLAQTWFAELLRDGFALTVSGVAEPFARLGAESRTTRRPGPRPGPRRGRRTRAGGLRRAGSSPRRAQGPQVVGRPQDPARHPERRIRTGRAGVPGGRRGPPPSSGSSPWRKRVSGNPGPAHTTTRWRSAVSTRTTPCWSACTRGTSTRLRALDWAPPGSTAPGQVSGVLHSAGSLRGLAAGAGQRDHLRRGPGPGRDDPAPGVEVGHMPGMACASWISISHPPGIFRWGGPSRARGRRRGRWPR